jgi:hypothetical protein
MSLKSAKQTAASIISRPKIERVQGATTPAQEGKNVQKIKKRIIKGLVREERKDNLHAQAKGEYESGIKFVVSQTSQRGDLFRFNKLTKDWFRAQYGIKPGLGCIYMGVSDRDKSAANEGRYIWVIVQGQLRLTEVLAIWVSPTKSNSCNLDDDDVE